MDNHFTKAKGHLAAVVAYQDSLREEYARPHHDRAAVADLQGAINRGLKAAEVHAVLAVAEALHDLQSVTR